MTQSLLRNLRRFLDVKSDFFIGSTVEFLYGTRWLKKSEQVCELNQKSFNGSQKVTSISFRKNTKQWSAQKCQLHDSERKKFIGSQSFRARFSAFLRLSSVMKVISKEKGGVRTAIDWHDDLDFSSSSFSTRFSYSIEIIFRNWTLTNSMFASEVTAECLEIAPSLSRLQKCHNL